MEEYQRQDDVLIKVLEERVNLWMESTTEYRKSLCAKLDVVIEKINILNARIDKLPCDARKPAWESLSNQVKAIWGFLGAICLAIIIEWVKGK